MGFTAEICRPAIRQPAPLPLQLLPHNAPDTFIELRRRDALRFVERVSVGHVHGLVITREAPKYRLESHESHRVSAARAFNCYPVTAKAWTAIRIRVVSAAPNGLPGPQAARVRAGVSTFRDPFVPSLPRLAEDAAAPRHRGGHQSPATRPSGPGGRPRFGIGCSGSLRRRTLARSRQWQSIGIGNV
jgi:hypothetical protein